MSEVRIRRWFLGAGDYFFAGAVDLGHVFRVSVFVVLGGGDAGGGCQFCG